MRCQAVVFDLFHTLVDSPSHAASNANLARMARTLGALPEEFAHLWGETYPERSLGILPSAEAAIDHICRLLELRVDASAIQAASQMRIELLREALTPRSGAIETLERVREAGYRVGLLTNCTPEIPAVWVESPLATLVDATVFSCCEGLKKPDSRVYGIVAGRLGVSADQCLYVGDGESEELTGAARAGMHPVLIRVPDRSLSGSCEADRWTGSSIDRLLEVLTLIG